MVGTASRSVVPVAGAAVRTRPCAMRRPGPSSSGRVAPRERRPAAAPPPVAMPVAARRSTAPVRAGRSRASTRRRLTRRGRVLLVMVLAALLLATFSLGRASSDASTPSDRPTVSHVTVRPGETLWQVATRVAPGNDPRITVQRLMRLNGMTSPALRAGESLVVPTRR